MKRAIKEKLLMDKMDVVKMVYCFEFVSHKFQNWKPPSERESSKGETVQKTREGKREAISQKQVKQWLHYTALFLS